jgi:hypothetical protein
MTNPMTTMGVHLGNMWRSAGAVLAGFLAVAVLSMVTDEVLHLLHVYPPWGQPMYNGLSFLALSYRIVFTIAGGYLTATFAPGNPMRHALALGVLGTVVGISSAIFTIPMHLGPSWYPISLAVTGLPCCWLGGLLYRARHAEG